MADTSFLSALSGVGDAVGLSSYGRAVTIQLAGTSGIESRRIGARLGGPGCAWHVIDVPMSEPLTIERQGTPKLPTRTTELAFAPVETIEANADVLGGDHYAALDLLTAPEMTANAPITVRSGDNSDGDDEDDARRSTTGFSVQLCWALGSTATWLTDAESPSAAVPQDAAPERSDDEEEHAHSERLSTAEAPQRDEPAPDAPMRPLQLEPEADGVALQSPSEPSGGLSVPESTSAGATAQGQAPLPPPPPPASTSEHSGGASLHEFGVLALVERSSPSPLRSRIAAVMTPPGDEDTSDDDSKRRSHLSRASSNARRRAPRDVRRRSTVQMDPIPNMMTPAVDDGDDVTKEEEQKQHVSEQDTPAAMGGNPTLRDAPGKGIPEVQSEGSSQDGDAYHQTASDAEDKDEREEKHEYDDKEEPPIFVHQPRRASDPPKVVGSAFHAMPTAALPVSMDSTDSPSTGLLPTAPTLTRAAPTPMAQNLFEGAAPESRLVFVEVLQLHAREGTSSARTVAVKLNWTPSEPDASEAEVEHAVVEAGHYQTALCTRATAAAVPQLSEPFLLVNSAVAAPAVMTLQCVLEKQYTVASSAPAMATALWSDTQTVLVPVLSASKGWRASTLVCFQDAGDTLKARLTFTTVHAYREEVLNLRAVEMMEGTVPWLELVLTPVLVCKSREDAQKASADMLAVRCIEPSSSATRGLPTPTPFFTAVGPRLPGQIPAAQLLRFDVSSPFTFIAITADGSHSQSEEGAAICETATIPVRYECLHAWTTEVVELRGAKFAAHYRFATQTSPEPTTMAFSARHASVQAPPSFAAAAETADEAAGVAAVYLLHLRLTPTTVLPASTAGGATATSGASPPASIVTLDCAGARVIVVERATDRIVACSDAVRLASVLRTTNGLPALSTQVAFQGVLRRPYVLDCFVLPFDTFAMARLYRPARGGAALAQYDGALSATVVLNPAALAAADESKSLTRTTLVLNAHPDKSPQSPVRASSRTTLCGLSVACAVQRCTYAPSECVFLLRSLRVRTQPVPGLDTTPTSSKAAAGPSAAPTSTHAQVWFSGSLPNVKDVVHSWAPGRDEDLDQAGVGAAPLRLHEGVATRLPLWFTTSETKLRLCVALAKVRAADADDGNLTAAEGCQSDPVLEAFEELRERVVRHRKRALRRLERTETDAVRDDARAIAMAVADDVVMSLDHYIEIDLSPSISAASDTEGKPRRHPFEASVTGTVRMNAHEVLQIDGVWLKVPDVASPQPVPMLYRPSARLWALRCSLVQRAAASDGEDERTVCAPFEVSSFPLDYTDPSPEDVHAALPGVPSDLFIRQRLRDQRKYGADAYSEAMVSGNASSRDAVARSSETVQILYRALLDSTRTSTAVSSSSKVTRVVFVFGDAYTTRTYVSLRLAEAVTAPNTAALPHPRPPHSGRPGARTTRSVHARGTADVLVPAAVMDSLTEVGVMSLTESQMIALFPGISHHRYPPFVEWYQGSLGVDRAVEQARREAARTRWQANLSEKDLGASRVVGSLAVRAAVQHPQGAPQLCYHTSTLCEPEGYFVFGGLDARGQLNDRAYFYWSHEQTWTNFDFLSTQTDAGAQRPATNVSAGAVGGPTARHGHVVVYRPSDRCVYVYGGMGYGGVVASVADRRATAPTPSALSVGYLSDTWRVRLEDGAVSRVEATVEDLAAPGDDASTANTSVNTPGAHPHRRYSSPLAASSGPLVRHRWRHTAVFYDDYMIVLGGKGLAPRDDAATTTSRHKDKHKVQPHAEALKEVVCSCARALYLDLANMEWQQRNCYGSDVPCPRYDHAVARQGTSLFLYGGRQGSDIAFEDKATAATKCNSRRSDSSTSTSRADERAEADVLDDLYRLDLVTRLWTRVAANGSVRPPPLAGASLSAGSVQRHGCLFLVGGAGEANKASSAMLDVFLFSTETQFWRRIAFEYTTLPPRVGLTTAVLKDHTKGSAASQQQQQQRRARRQRLPYATPATQVEVLVVGGAPTALVNTTDLHLRAFPLVEGPCVLQLSKPGGHRPGGDEAGAAAEAAPGVNTAASSRPPLPSAQAQTRSAASKYPTRTPSRPASSPPRPRQRPATAGAPASATTPGARSLRPLRPSRPTTAKSQPRAAPSAGAYTPQPPYTRRSGSESQRAATAISTYDFARVYGSAGLGANRPMTSFYTLTPAQQHNLVQRLYYNDTEWRRGRREELEARMYGPGSRAVSAHPAPRSRSASPQKAPLSARSQGHKKKKRHTQRKSGRHAQRVLALENPSLLQDGMTSSSDSMSSSSLPSSTSSIASVSVKPSPSLASSRSPSRTPSSHHSEASYAEDSFETGSTSSAASSPSSASSSAAAAEMQQVTATPAEVPPSPSPSHSFTSSSSANSYVAVTPTARVDAAHVDEAKAGDHQDAGAVASASDASSPSESAHEAEDRQSAASAGEEKEAGWEEAEAELELGEVTKEAQGDDDASSHLATPLSTHSAEEVDLVATPASLSANESPDAVEKDTSHSNRPSINSTPAAEPRAIIEEVGTLAQPEATPANASTQSSAPSTPMQGSHHAHDAEGREPSAGEAAEESGERDEASLSASAASAHELGDDAKSDSPVALDTVAAAEEPAVAASGYDDDDFEDDVDEDGSDADSEPAVAPMAPRNASSLASSRVSSSAEVPEAVVRSAASTPASEVVGSEKSSAIPSTPASVSSAPDSSVKSDPATPIASESAPHSDADEAAPYEDEWERSESEPSEKGPSSRSSPRSSVEEAAAPTPAHATPPPSSSAQSSSSVRSTEHLATPTGAVEAPQYEDEWADAEVKTDDGDEEEDTDKDRDANQAVGPAIRDDASASTAMETSHDEAPLSEDAVQAIQARPSVGDPRAGRAVSSASEPESPSNPAEMLSSGVASEVHDDVNDTAAAPAPAAPTTSSSDDGSEDAPASEEASVSDDDADERPRAATAQTDSDADGESERPASGGGGDGLVPSSPASSASTPTSSHEDGPFDVEYERPPVSDDDEREDDAAPVAETPAHEVDDEWAELGDADRSVPSGAASSVDESDRDVEVRSEAAAAPAVISHPATSSDDSDSDSEPAVNSERSSTSEKSEGGVPPVVGAESEERDDNWQELDDAAPARQPSSADDSDDDSDPAVNSERSSTSEKSEGGVPPVVGAESEERDDNWQELDDAAPAQQPSSADDSDDDSDPAVNSEQSSTSDDDGDVVPAPACATSTPSSADEDAHPSAVEQDHAQIGSDEEEEDDAAPVAETPAHEVDDEWAELGDADRSVPAVPSGAASSVDESDRDSEPALKLEQSRTSDEDAPSSAPAPAPTADEWEELGDAADVQNPPSSGRSVDVGEPALTLEPSRTSDEEAPSSAPLEEVEEASASGDTEQRHGTDSGATDVASSARDEDDDTHAPSPEVQPEAAADEWAELDDSTPAVPKPAAASSSASSSSTPSVAPAHDEPKPVPAPARASRDEWAELDDDEALPLLPRAGDYGQSASEEAHESLSISDWNRLSIEAHMHAAAALYDGSGASAAVRSEASAPLGYNSAGNGGVVPSLTPMVYPTSVEIDAPLDACHDQSASTAVTYGRSVDHSVPLVMMGASVLQDAGLPRALQHVESINVSHANAAATSPPPTVDIVPHRVQEEDADEDEEGYDWVTEEEEEAADEASDDEAEVAPAVVNIPRLPLPQAAAAQEPERVMAPPDDMDDEEYEWVTDDEEDDDAEGHRHGDVLGSDEEDERAVEEARGDGTPSGDALAFPNQDIVEPTPPPPPPEDAGADAEDGEAAGSEGKHEAANLNAVPPDADGIYDDDFDF